MRQDLFRAASTIQKLKKERDEYRFAYEVLKDESVSKKDLLRNQSFIDSLRDSNELLQKEVKKLRKENDLKEKTISSLEDKLLQAKQSFKNHQKSLKDIEDARKELNYEISNSKFKSSQYSNIQEILNQTKTLLNNLKQAPSIYLIFKQIAHCNKKFLNLVETENFSKAFQILSKLLNEMLGNFRFSEENESFCSSDELGTWTGKNLKEDLRESNEQQSLRLKMLKKKLQETQNEMKSENQGFRSIKSHKKLLSCDLNSGSGKNNQNSLRKSCNLQDFDEEMTKSEAFLTQSSNKGIQRAGSSKSPLRMPGSPKGRFEQFHVPFRRVHGSASVAECLGKAGNKK
jgi:flagellar biosynthesis chaperone FliJ